jgi:hypothetical protein
MGAGKLMMVNIIRNGSPRLKKKEKFLERYSMKMKVNYNFSFYWEMETIIPNIKKIMISILIIYSILNFY